MPRILAHMPKHTSKKGDTGFVKHGVNRDLRPEFKERLTTLTDVAKREGRTGQAKKYQKALSSLENLTDKVTDVHTLEGQAGFSDAVIGKLEKVQQNASKTGRIGGLNNDQRIFRETMDREARAAQLYKDRSLQSRSITPNTMYDPFRAARSPTPTWRNPYEVALRVSGPRLAEGSIHDYAPAPLQVKLKRRVELPGASSNPNSSARVRVLEVEELQSFGWEPRAVGPAEVLSVRELSQSRQSYRAPSRAESRQSSRAGTPSAPWRSAVNHRPSRSDTPGYMRPTYNSDSRHELTQSAQSNRQRAW